MKALKYLRFVVAMIALGAVVLLFSGKDYPVKILDVQFTAALQRAILDGTVFAACLFAGVVVLTLLFGRIYCSTLCPLGLAQELFGLLFRRKVPVRKSNPFKYILAALVFGVLIGGSAVIVRCIDPYTLFGSAASGAYLGMGAAVVLALFVAFGKRFFCVHICPVGAVLGLIAKHSVFQVGIDNRKCVSCGLCAAKCPTGSIDFKNKKVDNETCIKCFDCMGACRRGGIRFGRIPAYPLAMNESRRKMLIGGAGLAAFAVLAFKSGAIVSKKIAARVKSVILPAGARSPEKFANNCLNCNLCVQNCPMKILKKADSDYPAVHIDLSENFCAFDCHKCGDVCPSGAIRRLSLSDKRRTQTGLAGVDESKCVKCGLCVMKCPKHAVKKERFEDFPRFDSDLCIGCGACKIACPVGAITVQPLEEQKLLSE